MHWIDRIPEPVNLESAQAMIARIQAQADGQGRSLRVPPPEPTTCCGRGCSGCVWEGWLAAVLYWRDEATLVLD